MDIVNQIQYLQQQLNKSIKLLRQTGENYARAYTEYRVALAQELVKLKDEGYAITLAGDIARGKPEIAKLKFKEISTEAIYKANLESINALKIEIKVLSNQYDKEWSNDANNNI